MRTEDFASDLNNLEFLINKSILVINNGEEVSLEVFDKFDKITIYYLSSYQELGGTEIRFFTSIYRKILTIAKRLAVLEKIPVNKLNKLVDYQEEICEVFDNDTTRLKNKINNELKEIKYLLS